MSTSQMQKLCFAGHPRLEMTPAHYRGSEPGKAFIYILIHTGKKKPFYIGECAKSKSYDVATRIKRHFHRSGTMSRVRINMDRFGYAVPESFDAYIRLLPKSYTCEMKCRSLEGWIIQKICHEKRTQAPDFCVTKYSAPTHNCAKLAATIIHEFSTYS